jgi:hypothetical protein
MCPLIVPEIWIAELVAHVAEIVTDQAGTSLAQVIDPVHDVQPLYESVIPALGNVWVCPTAIEERSRVSAK